MTTNVEGNNTDMITENNTNINTTNPSNTNKTEHSLGNEKKNKKMTSAVAATDLASSMTSFNALLRHLNPYGPSPPPHQSSVWTTVNGISVASGECVGVGNKGGWVIRVK